MPNVCIHCGEAMQSRQGYIPHPEGPLHTWCDKPRERGQLRIQGAAIALRAAFHAVERAESLGHDPCEALDDLDAVNVLAAHDGEE